MSWGPTRGERGPGGPSTTGARRDRAAHRAPFRTCRRAASPDRPRPYPPRLGGAAPRRPVASVPPVVEDGSRKRLIEGHHIHAPTDRMDPPDGVERGVEALDAGAAFSACRERPHPPPG